MQPDLIEVIKQQRNAALDALANASADNIRLVNLVNAQREKIAELEKAIVPSDTSKEPSAPTPSGTE